MRKSATARCLHFFTPGPPDECWPWRGAVTKKTGYGTIWEDGRNRLAHRVVYEALRGPFAAESLDHTCHNDDDACPGGRVCLHRRCVNPAHLEPVTKAVNTSRGAARRKTCSKGHPLDGVRGARGSNRAGERYCKTCAGDYQYIVRDELRAGVRPQPRTVICADCGKAKPLCARGLCRPCYTRMYRATKGAVARPGRVREQRERAARPSSAPSRA